MLENINLDKVYWKEDNKEFIKEWSDKLSLLQRKCKEAGIPIIILFEGWGADGKGTLINKLITPLDPRGFNVYTTTKTTKEERLHPYLWRFFIKTPAKGRIHIFDGSWYQRVVTERMDGNLSEEALFHAYDEIVDFEQMLAEDGTVIIKFFLHISKKEQKKRLQKLEQSKITSWRVTKKDWKRHEKYDEYLTNYDEMLSKTDTSFAPWTIIEATQKQYAVAKIIHTVVKCLTEALEKKPMKEIAEIKNDRKPFFEQEELFKTGVLQSVDLSKSYTKKEYKKELKKLQQRMAVLHNEIYLKRIPVIIAFEGWDAAGKGGAIKRVTEKLDPRGYEVIPIAAPNDMERSHHYLWRFWNHIPKSGHIAIFDRTWYGRVLVERVEGFCTEEECKRAYKEINAMEDYLVDEGSVVLKFWLHIDKEEQKKRFEERQNTPKKQWKITEEDWRNREKWQEYEAAVDEMIVRTSTKKAPWCIVEANSKYYARIKILREIVTGIERKIQCSKK